MAAVQFEGLQRAIDREQVRSGRILATYRVSIVVASLVLAALMARLGRPQCGAILPVLWTYLAFGAVFLFVSWRMPRLCRHGGLVSATRSTWPRASWR